MGRRQQARTQPTHSVEVRQTYDRVLAGASVRRRYVEVGASGRVHLLEKGAGPPVVLLHGTGTSAGFFMPLLHELGGVRALAPDLPGVGLSDPIDLPRNRYRNTAVAWLDRLLDQLVLLGVPALPKTRCPLPIRLAATPGLGELLSRLAPPTPKSVLRLASFMGEKATLPRHPDLVDLLVAVGRDPVAETVTELIPHARLEVLPTGHGPWLGQPVQTAATVVDFVRDQINAPRPS